jgi:hypothetical protein
MEINPAMRSTKNISRPENISISYALFVDSIGVNF